MKEYIVFLGIGMIVLGMFLTVIGSFLTQDSSNKTNDTSSNSQFFVGGFIGFIPFGFANSKTSFIIGTTLTIVVIITFLLIKKFT